MKPRTFFSVLMSEVKSFYSDFRYARHFESELSSLKMLKNSKVGERCFIIGNGPSLKEQDLLLLTNEYTFITNHFLNHDQLQEINPSFYCASDANFFFPNINSQWESKLADLPEKTKLFFSYRSAKKIMESKIITRYKSYFLKYHAKKIWEYNKFQSNVENFVYSGDTVIIDFCLPLALYMGFSEIYLLGVDCNYSFGSSGKVSYGFRTENVNTERSSDAYLQGKWIDNVFRSYRVVRDSSDISIYDATHKGHLDVFPKVEFVDIVGIKK